MGRQFRLIIWQRLRDGEPWFHTDLVRQRIVSSPTWLLVSAQVKSRPELLADQKDSQNTTNCLELKRSLEPTPNTLELISEKEFKYTSCSVKNYFLQKQRYFARD